MGLMLLRFSLMWDRLLFLNLRRNLLRRFLKVMFLLLSMRIWGMLLLSIVFMVLYWAPSFLFWRLSLLFMRMVRLFFNILVLIIGHSPHVYIILQIWELIIHILVLMVKHVFVWSLGNTFLHYIFFVRLRSRRSIRTMLSVLLHNWLLGGNHLFFPNSIIR